MTDRVILESWKEIAAYLGRSVRAVQLWEKEERLPIHRHQHDKQGTVFAYRDELDQWLKARSTPPAKQTSTSRRRILELAAAILLTAIVVITITAVVWSSRETASPVDVESIAVLPFTHDAGVGEHVSDGLTELLIDELATMPDLRVMARSSVFHYKGKSILPARIGEELNVDAVVTGDIRREADRYVVHAELSDVRDGAQLWAGRYDVAPAELSLVQRKIFADLTTTLRGRATPHPAAQKYSRNAEAYEQYLLGLREWNARMRDGRGSREALDASVRHFQRAIELDPQFAAAHAGLANAYGVMVGYDQIPPGEGTVRVLASARKALELDPNNAEALTSIATSSFNNLWDFEGAERAWRRAIELNPNYATAHQWYGLGLQELGRFDEARREIDLAYSLDPLSLPVVSSRCMNRYFARQYREAVAFAREVEERDPSRAVPTCMTGSMIAMGALDEYLAYLDARKAPFADVARESYRSGGVRGIYESRLKNLLERPETAGAGNVTIARHYAFLGQPDPAFAWLERAYERRDASMPEFHLHPEFDSIRNDPRFHDLAKRIGLPRSALEASAALANKMH